jgi:hypothetical protein
MVPAPIDQNLLACYHAIFGITDIRSDTLSRLTKWPQFLAAHATRDLAVQRHDLYEWHQVLNLFDFQTEYEYVLDVFYRYNFLEQYRQLFGHTPGYREQHVNSDAARAALHQLYQKLSMDSFAIVSHKIDGLIRQYGTPNRELDNQIIRWLYDNPDRPPVASDSFMNTQPAYVPFARPRRPGKENGDPENARLPALLQQLEALV